MSVLPKSIEKVIEGFERLPGIGPKTAARMAYHFLRAPEDRALDLAAALEDMKKSIVTCGVCFNAADTNPCSICGDSRRDHSKLCVVEEPLDVVAIEKSGVFDGVYFVLGGVISPADGVEPEHLRMRELRNRLVNPGENSLWKKTSGEKSLEVIIATNPNLEGEATASYIIEMTKKLGEKPDGMKLTVSRLAMGLPTGADIEYADRLTLKRALDGRGLIE